VVSILHIFLPHSCTHVFSSLLFSTMRATCSAHCVLLDLIILFPRSTSYEAPYCGIFSSHRKLLFLGERNCINMKLNICDCHLVSKLPTSSLVIHVKKSPFGLFVWKNKYSERHIQIVVVSMDREAAVLFQRPMFKTYNIMLCIPANILCVRNTFVIKLKEIKAVDAYISK
jgi:hypothetical protein